MTRAAAKPRLLFVDDDVETCRAFVRTVRGLNYEVDTVQTPGAALERARSYAYPVIVTDLYLQGTDAYAVIDAIGSLRSDTTFVIMTGQPGAFQASRVATHAAIASLMAKPWERDDLEAKLEFAQQLHRRRSLTRQAVAGPEQLRVLAIEDNPGDAYLLRELFTGVENLSLTFVRTLAEATRMLHEYTFDVVMTDLSLPDAQGADTVFRLRSAGPDAAILVCTGIDDQALLVQLLQLGAHEWLSKSELDPTSVLRALQVAKERKAFEQRLTKLAYYDALTGVLNRAGWQERTANAVGRASRRGEQLAIAMVDLDGFKTVNDQLGHEAGDAVLQEIGSRLQGLVREYDTVARLGGDEFALLLTDLPESFSAQTFGDRLVQELCAPLEIPGVGQRQIGASVGIGLFPQHGRSVPALLKAADDAMYRAKAAGKGVALVASSQAFSNFPV